MRPNRLVLFRAKHIGTKKWIYGWPIQCAGRVFMVDKDNKTALRAFTTHDHDAYDWRTSEVDADTLCEFTGAFDKHGNPIYESDIVRKRTYQGMKNCQVFFFSGYFHCGWGGGSSTATHPYLLEDKNIEIVGNVFDNPEVLSE